MLKFSLYCFIKCLKIRVKNSLYHNLQIKKSFSNKASKPNLSNHSLFKNNTLPQSCFKCSICFKILKSSSSFGKHIRNRHGEKWECPYCKIKYSDKCSHIICKVKEKLLITKFIQSFLSRNNPITFVKKTAIPEFR